MSSVDYQIDGLRAMVKMSIAAHMGVEDAHRLVLHLTEVYPQSLTDFTGLSSTGGPGEQVKGLFTRTTYADRLERETEYGYRAVAGRMLRNIIRNYDELASE